MGGGDRDAQGLGPPDLVVRRRVAVPRRRGDHATFDVETEKGLLGEGRGFDRDRRPLGKKLLLNYYTLFRRLINRHGPASQVGRILVVLARERMQRKATVASKVSAFRPRHDEQVQLAFADDRA